MDKEVARAFCGRAKCRCFTKQNSAMQEECMALITSKHFQQIEMAKYYK